MSLFIPYLILNLDSSIEVSQIKPSVAKKLDNSSDKEILLKLMTQSSNIKIMVELIEYYKEYYKADYDDLLNLYLTGKISPISNREIKIYKIISKWPIYNNYFEQFIRKYVLTPIQTDNRKG